MKAVEYVKIPLVRLTRKELMARNDSALQRTGEMLDLDELVKRTCSTRGGTFAWTRLRGPSEWPAVGPWCAGPGSKQSGFH